MSVDIKVRPIKRTSDYFLVTFHKRALESESEQGTPGEDNLSREEYLQQKLNATRQELQAAVEELETTNEELKSANEELQANNEELQSTNEELESSREELQSTNEELETTNSELHRKNQELLKADDDARNLFHATDIGTIFLDDHLRIKRFTPAATRIFNLIEMDVERNIEHITSNLLYEGFVEDVRDVLENLNKKEKEVQTKDGRWLAMRMLPYRTSANVIEGVVITFNEVTGLKGTQITLESIMKTLKYPLVVLEDDLRVSSANRAFYDTFRLREKDVVGRSFFDPDGSLQAPEPEGGPGITPGKGNDE